MKLVMNIPDYVKEQADVGKGEELGIPYWLVYTIANGIPLTEESDAIETLNQEPRIGRCKDCKWWKDSDGVFRRGIGAESQCPMNRIEVYEGNGYCFLFEPKMSEIPTDSEEKNRLQNNKM